MTKAALAKMLRKHRQRLNLTQGEMAKLLKMNRQTYINWESPRRVGMPGPNELDYINLMLNGGK